jgi:hypothetical protein
VPFVHRSADVALHATHALPPPPQFANDGASHVLPAQQPLAHVCEQPAHALLTHWSPLAHAEHAPPPEPHAFATLPGMHTLFWQQPPAQLDALHTHCPLTHVRPAPHGEFAPHLHDPPEQLSAVAASHVEHAPPPVPHVASDDGLQTLPLQHPLAHDVASQTHWPPTHL